jgi:hypothetical protein
MSISQFLKNAAATGMPIFTRDASGNITGLRGAAFYPISIPGSFADGVTADYAAINSIITSAGNGGIVQFQAGKIYAVDRSITFLPNQIVRGNGATIKRVPQVTTTTTDTITSGTTQSFNVATGTGANFKVGQTINAFNGANYSTQNLLITSIVGDLISTATTVVASAGSPWSGTTTIALSFSSVKTDSGVQLDSLNFDGNKSNWTKYHWEVTNEIQVANGSNTITKCSLNNAPGEGIVETNVSNVTGNKIFANKITNINGNGIHLSTSTDTQIGQNFIYNTNIDGVNVGHNGGCVTISNNVNDYKINDNIFDTGRAGVGQIDSAGNSLVNISNNIMHNMSAYFIECRGPTVNITDVIITGNRFYNDSAPSAAALIAVDITDTSAGTISRVNVSGNNFHNAGLTVGRLLNFVIANNTFETDYMVADNYHNHINAIGIMNDGVIIGNSMKWGQMGILLATNNTDVVISGNTCNKQYYYGINTVGGTGLNVLIANNSITNDTNVNNSYQGITIGSNTVVRGNNVNLQAGHSGIRINGVAGAVVQNNTVRASAAGKTIRVETGSTGYVVAENQVNYAVLDTPAVGIRVANNDVIT